MLKIKKYTKKRTKLKKTKNILNEKKYKLTYENEIKQKKRLKNIRRRIVYRLQTSADVKRH
jgi:flagellin-specific chaperone FliS